MRYPASEKLEIIRLVEQSHLPVRRVLEQIGIPRSTFYRWCDLYQTGGPEALDDRSPRPDRVWNRIPDDVRAPYDVHEVIARIVDGSELHEFKVVYGALSDADIWRIFRYGVLPTGRAAMKIRNKSVNKFCTSECAKSRLLLSFCFHQQNCGLRR